jgi:hypothetical protein
VSARWLGQQRKRCRQVVLPQEEETPGRLPRAFFGSRSTHVAIESMSLGRDPVNPPQEGGGGCLLCLRGADHFPDGPSASRRNLRVARSAISHPLERPMQATVT